MTVAAARDAVLGLPPDAGILLVCHVNPDGDALGSMLGFGYGLRQLGFTRVTASFAGPFVVPAVLDFLPWRGLLLPAAEVDPAPELVVSFDAASSARLGELATVLRDAPVSVVLDHHASNPGFAGINVIDPDAAATAVVAERLLADLGVTLDPTIAECLYVGLATDTGSFRRVGTPAVHTLAARLLATGIPAGEISRRLFDDRPFGAVRLSGDVLARAELEPTRAGGRGLVWSYATRADLERHAQPPEAMEPLVDGLSRTTEADVACLVKQVAENEWAVSLRSRGAIDVSSVAMALGGGGHRFAAGFTGSGTAVDVIDLVRAELDRVAG